MQINGKTRTNRTSNRFMAFFGLPLAMRHECSWGRMARSIGAACGRSAAMRGCLPWRFRASQGAFPCVASSRPVRFPASVSHPVPREESLWFPRLSPFLTHFSQRQPIIPPLRYAKTSIAIATAIGCELHLSDYEWNPCRRKSVPEPELTVLVVGD